MGLRWLITFILSCLLATPLFAAQNPPATQVLSFEDFSRRVLAYYPKLKSSKADIEIVLARAMQAKAGFWPTLDLSAGYRVTNDPVDVFGMLLRQERFTSGDFDIKRLNSPDRHQDFSAGLHLDIPLFDAMQTISRVRAARAQLKASRAEADFTRMEALLLAEDAYMNALTLEKLSQIIDDINVSTDSDLKKAVDLKDKGVILGADYYAARVVSAEFLKAQHEIKRQQKAMMMLLNIMMGESLDVIWILEDSFKTPLAPLSLETDMVAAALANRPDLLALATRMEASTVTTQRERLSCLPRLSAFADAGHDRDRFLESGGNHYAIGFKVGMPLFDPGRRGRVKEALENEKKMKEEMRMLEDNIRRDIIEESSRLASFEDNLPVALSMQEDARKALELTLPLYNEGRKSIADVLQMRRMYWQAMEAYRKIFFGLWMSSLRLEFISGRLHEDSVKKLMEGGAR